MKMVRQSGPWEKRISAPFLNWMNGLTPSCCLFVRLVVCIIVSFLPFAVYAHTAAWAADTTLAWLFLAAGVIYFPGVFMRTSVRERFSGLSPVGWWGLVRRAPFSYAGLLGAICAGGWIILNLPSGPLMDFAMVPVKLYVACVLMNMCGLFMLKHEFAGEEEDGSFSPSGPAAS